MDIHPMCGSSYFMFYAEEVEMLIEGRFRTRKCLLCDGTGWIHHRDGEIVGTGYKEDWSSEDASDWITPEGCENCYGFGQIITFTE